jgi:hypothetical protein
VNSELVTPLERGVERRRTLRRPARELAITAMGPLTMLAGVVWAVAQPYRLAFLHPEGKGFYDFLVQPQLLVVAVGLFFILVITPGILEDLEDGDGSSR